MNDIQDFAYRHGAELLRTGYQILLHDNACDDMIVKSVWCSPESHQLHMTVEYAKGRTETCSIANTDELAIDLGVAPNQMWYRGDDDTALAIIEDGVRRIDPWQKSEAERAVDQLGRSNPGHRRNTMQSAFTPKGGTIVKLLATATDQVLPYVSSLGQGYRLTEEANALVPASVREPSGWYEDKIGVLTIRTTLPTATREVRHITTGMEYLDNVVLLKEHLQLG